MFLLLELGKKGKSIRTPTKRGHLLKTMEKREQTVGHSSCVPPPSSPSGTSSEGQTYQLLALSGASLKGPTKNKYR